MTAPALTYTGYRPGTWVVLHLVDGNGDPLDEDDSALARVLDSNLAVTTVRLPGGRIRTVSTHDLHIAELRAPTPSTNGRWRVGRDGEGYWYTPSPALLTPMTRITCCSSSSSATGCPAGSGMP